MFTASLTECSCFLSSPHFSKLFKTSHPTLPNNKAMSFQVAWKNWKKILLCDILGYVTSNTIYDLQRYSQQIFYLKLYILGYLRNVNVTLHKVNNTQHYVKSNLCNAMLSRRVILLHNTEKTFFQNNQKSVKIRNLQKCCYCMKWFSGDPN